MKAFVINENQIKQVGLIVAGVIVAVFLAGYFLGSKLNDTTQTVSDQSKVIPVPALAPVIDAKVNAQNNIKEKQKQNKDKKTSKAEKKKATKDNKKASKQKSEKKAIADKKSRAIKKTQADNKDKKNLTDKKPAPKKTAAPKKANSKKIANNKVDAGQKTQSAAQASAQSSAVQSSGDKKGSSTSNDKVYSIQAGMFSSETNANSFIEKLAAKKFDAYLSSFVSSSGTVKYNVRVGRFAQRDQARVLLKDFQKSFSSPAYVVISQP